MENKLKAYVNDLFKELNQTESLQETKEELIINLTEKYHDLIADGLSNEQAYKKVIASIGDVEELIEAEASNPKVEQKVEVNIINSKKSYPMLSRIMQAMAVILFILCPVPLIVLSSISESLEVFGIVALLSMVAIGVGLLILANDKDEKKERKKSSNKSNTSESIDILSYRDKQRQKNINGLVYLIAAIIFFSNLFTGWGYGFIIFIAAYGVTKIIELVWFYQRINALEKAHTPVSPQLIKEETYRLATSTVWVVAVILFFSNFSRFRISWIVFLIAAAVVQILKIILDMEVDNEEN